MTQTEVRVTGGMVRGRLEGGVAVFRGLPFAAAPVGALRFAAPRPAEPWDGVREAFEYGPPPPQPLRSTDGDDWLTVNVFTPDPGSGAGLPVMVWFHGGGFTIGVSSSPEYDGGRLAREHGVVVVTFNYRVGFEGFAQIAGAPANRGLLDQVALLEWVQQNIRAFGGDPAEVTVFGQSAGAGSIAALLAMSRADGLFGRAITSSVPGVLLSPELAGDLAAACAAELGVGATVAELGDVEPELLVMAAEAVRGAMQERWGLAAKRGIQFAPVVDGDVLPETPWRAVAAGRARNIALMVGHTRDEQRLFSLLQGILGQVTAEMAAEAVDLFAPKNATYPSISAPEALFDVVHGDWLFRMPSLHLAEAQAAAGGPVHLFELTYQGALGAAHGLDIPLVFGNFDQGQTAALVAGSPAPELEELAARMRKVWAAGPDWPVYESEQRLTMVFDAVSSVQPYPEDESRLIWQGHDWLALPLEG